MFFLKTFTACLLLMPCLLVQAADQTSLHEDDVTFIHRATECNLMEIQSSQAALKRTLSAEEKQFAQTLIDDHTKANRELAALAQRKGVTPPSELPAKVQKHLAEMSEVKDADFAEEYLEDQISAHKKAIDLFEDQIDDGKDADLKAYATTHLPHLKMHLETAKKLEDKH
jgi:putative membrane protein